MAIKRGGTMNKYVVKNCPNCMKDIYSKEDRYFCYHPVLSIGTDCKDCTNCLIKRVIDKCRERHVGYIDEAYTKDEILQLFEIEECE